MPVSLSFFALFKICCLYLNWLNRQMIVHGWPWYLPDWLRDLTWWHLSISTSVSKPQLFFTTSWTFSSHVFHVSFGVSRKPSVRRLFLWDISSSSTSFAETSSVSKRSFSIDLMLFPYLVMSFFMFLNSSSSYLCVNSRLLDSSHISVAILSRRSFVAFRFELIRALMVFHVQPVLLLLFVGWYQRVILHLHLFLCVTSEVFLAQKHSLSVQLFSLLILI